MATTYNITEQDKYTVSEIDNALGSLKTKLNNQYLSDGTKKKVQKLHDKYTAQKAKTIRLYERKRKKSPSLKGISVSALSVKKILELSDRDKGKDPKFREIGPVINFFLANKMENTFAIVGAGLAVTGFLGSSAGQEMMTKVGTKIKDWAEATFLNANGLNWSAILFTSGVAIFAGAMIKKGIRKSMEATAIHRHEAEEAMNAGTARDHDNLESNKQSLIDQASAGKEIDNETFNYLLSVASNPNNKPSVIKAANNILNAARANRAAAKTNLEKSLIESALNSNKQVNGELINISIKEAMTAHLKMKEIQRLISDSTVLADEAAVKTDLGLTKTNKLNGTNKTLSDCAIDNNKLKQLIIEGVDNVDKLKDHLSISTKLTNEQKALAEKIIAKAKAQQDLINKKAAGEYQVDSSTKKIEIPVFINGSYTYHNQDFIERVRNSAILTAAENVNIPVGKGSSGSATEKKKEATKFESQHAQQVREVEENMMKELKAERTGLVQ